MLTCSSCCRVPCLCCRGCPGMIQLLHSILLNPCLVYSRDTRLVHTFWLHMTHFPVCTVSSGMWIIVWSYLEHLPELEIAVYILQSFMAYLFKRFNYLKKIRSYIQVAYCFWVGTSYLTGIFSIICLCYHGESWYGLSAWWQWRRCQWGTWMSKKIGGGGEIRTLSAVSV